MADTALITRLPHLPNELIYAKLFRDVQNSAFLRQQLVNGNTEFEFAFIDATTILSTKHLLAACFRAINDAAHSRLRSRNVHSEIVFALNPSNNIAESFRRFGVQDTSTSLIALKVLSIPAASSLNDSGSGSGGSEVNEQHTAIANIAQHLQTHVQGTPLPFSDESLLAEADVERIRKMYKAPALAAIKSKDVTSTSTSTSNKVNGTAKIGGKQFVELEAILLGSMAIKGS